MIGGRVKYGDSKSSIGKECRFDLMGGELNLLNYDRMKYGSCIKSYLSLLRMEKDDGTAKMVIIIFFDLF